MAAKQIAEEAEFRIAFLDDRKGPRQTVIRGVRTKLPKGWDCLECPLLANPREYPSWLINNRIVVLMVDQLLDEQALDSSAPVQYKGHQVIGIIREQLPDFPIIVVTRAVEDHDLQEHFGEADDIVNRTELLKKTDQYVTRIVRLGHAYLAQYEEELATLTELSKKKAAGEITNEEVEVLNAVQAKLGLPSLISSAGDDALASLETEIVKMELLQKKVETFLQRETTKKHPSRRRDKKE